MNLVILIGRLTKEVELKGDETKYCRFSIAVDNPFKKGEADFINCVAFGKTAEVIASYTSKGDKIGLQGQLKMNKRDIEGKIEITYSVNVNAVELLGSKKEGGEKEEDFPW